GVVTQQQLDFWSWISRYYMCAEGEVLKAALPGGFLLESETLIQLSSKENSDESQLDDQEYLIYEALQTQSSLKIQEIIQLLDKKTVLPVINRLVAKNIVVVNQEIFEQYKPKLIRYVKMGENYSSEGTLQTLLEELSKASKQRDAVLTFFNLQAKKPKKPIELKELSAASGVSASVIKTLIDKEIFSEYFIQTDRVQFEGEITNTYLELNEGQKKALGEIESAFSENEVCLLHGVTSSGKTEIYLKLIESAISEGKQVLYLLPEIALTSQLVTRLQAFFGEQVSVYHSKYSVNERMEVYRNVLNNEDKAKIVLGARSSLFLPFKNLGLIV